VDAVTTAWYRRQAALSLQTSRRVEALWRQVDPDRITESWVELLPQAVTITTAGQVATSTQATEYVSAQVRQQGVEPQPEGKVNPLAFAGAAADGRPLESLLLLPAIAAKLRIAQGLAPKDALLSGLGSLISMTSTEVADAGKQATQVALTADTTVKGYTRVVTLPACSRCIILGGRTYKWNSGFQRHPNCFPAGVKVAGPSHQAATRRWHEGELVVIRTASGKELSVTGNHPVLTDRGWVAANLLQEGDHVVGSLRSEGARPLVVPDEHQMPARVEDLWGARRVVPLLQVPTSAEDFHGDGLNGQVDIELLDGFLDDWPLASLSEPFEHLLLAGGADAGSAFSTESHLDRLVLGALASADGSMGSLGLSATLGFGHLAGAHEASVGVGSRLNASLLQVAADHVATDAVLVAERVLALAVEVAADDLLAGHARGEAVVPKWDATGDGRTPESLRAYAERGSDLRERLAGDVQLDAVVELQRVDFSGHVFNLSTSEGWMDANGIIVSNCDCTHRPYTTLEDAIAQGPNAMFERMSAAEQDKTFGKASAQAVRDGADISQVVNAKRGMTLPGQGYGGRAGRTTTEGTTKRGVYGRQRRANGGRAERLSVDAIYWQANGNRDEAIKLLRKYAYLRD
jgi:hypothetical protein